MTEDGISDAHLKKFNDAVHPSPKGKATITVETVIEISYEEAREWLDATDRFDHELFWEMVWENMSDSRVSKLSLS